MYRWCTAVGILRVNVLSVRFNGFIIGSSDQGAENILHPHLLNSVLFLLTHFDVDIFYFLSADHKNGCMVRYFFFPEHATHFITVTTVTRH